MRRRLRLITESNVILICTTDNSCPGQFTQMWVKYITFTRNFPACVTTHGAAAAAAQTRPMFSRQACLYPRSSWSLSPQQPVSIPAASTLLFPEQPALPPRHSVPIPAKTAQRKVDFKAPFTQQRFTRKHKGFSFASLGLHDN